ncbi:hypothetical protein [Streptomyces sp. NPDC051452]|uniref:hypothetical protein n=1 Tax=Streptomyces sp. NPDC051452 TaxID=3365654 RepID=UPI0037A09813
MDGEVLSGLIGLGGALIGGAVSVWATVATQKQQAQESYRQQREEQHKLIEQRGREAGEKALTELYALRRHLVECTQDNIPEDHQPWRKIAKDHMDEAELAVGLMPQASEVRERIEEVLEAAFIHMVRSSGEVDREVLHAKRGATEAIDILSAYMRGDRLPEASAWAMRYREHAAHSAATYALENPVDED